MSRFQTGVGVFFSSRVTALRTAISLASAPFLGGALPEDFAIFSSSVFSTSRGGVIPSVALVISISRVTSATLVVTTSPWDTIRLGRGWYWGPGTLTFESYVLAPEVTLVLLLDDSGTLTNWHVAWLVSSLGKLVTILWEDSNRRPGIILLLELKRPASSL